MKSPNSPQKKLWFLLGLLFLTQEGLKMLEALLQMGRLRHKASWRWRFHFAGLWWCFEAYSTKTSSKSALVWLAQALFTHTWNQKFFLGQVVGQDTLVRQDKTRQDKHEGPQLVKTPWSDKTTQDKTWRPPVRPPKKNFGFCLAYVSWPKKA